MKRWLFVALALVVAAGALYAVVTARTGGSQDEEIGAASRARLERVLRDSDREPASPKEQRR